VAAVLLAGIVAGVVLALGGGDDDSSATARGPSGGQLVAVDLASGGSSRRILSVEGSVVERMARPSVSLVSKSG
jgi:hypothetical protein